MLCISLFGVLRLEVDGVAVAPPSSRQARLLLAMLALERRPHSREVLAARLWPEVLDESARTSLRTALAKLRAALGADADRFVVVSRERVGLADEQTVWTDVGEVERLLEARQLDTALALWDDELLTGLEEEWVLERRDALRVHVSEALARGAADAEAGGDLASALWLTRRQADLDVLAEEPHCHLMRRLAASGDRAAALSVYEKLAARMRTELRTMPSPATRELAEALRSGAAVAHGARQLASAELHSHDPVRVCLVLPRPLQWPAGGPFVGRDADLARLRGLWADVPAAAPGAVFVTGEAGIGKTRLAAELARTVVADGALVLYGRCDEGLAVPYQPFVEALRPYARAIGIDQIRAALGPLAPHLPRLLPELEALGRPDRGDPESDRFALFDAVLSLLEAATHTQRVLLVLDDLHWAARPTLQLLRYLIRTERPLGALLLSTYRETHVQPADSLQQLLADLQRDACAAKLSIGGLDDHAIAALLDAMAGHGVDVRAAELVELVRAQTGGNAFFIREFLAHLCESGAFDGEGRPGSRDLRVAEHWVPERLRDVIRHRVARLSEPTGRALSVAAVAGPTFSLAVVERVMGRTADVLDAIEEAVAARLLAETGPATYAFAHALVRQALYGELSATRRMRLHRQLGEALETLDDREAQVEALAHHFAQAAADDHGVKAATYALAAGRSATARLGYEEAAAQYERGLQALTATGQPQEQLRCELLLALGEARWGTGEIDKARQACQQAAELAEQLGDAPALGRAALGFCGPYRFEMAAAATRSGTGLLERAIAALDRDDSALRAQLIGRLVVYTQAWHDKSVLARQALEIARRLADKATIADVLASSLWAGGGPDSLHESMATARELGRVADEVGDRRLRALARSWQLDFLLELGDINQVELELEALQRLADTRNERYVQWILAVFRANHAHLRGRLGDCDRLAHDALAHRFEGHDEPAAQVFGLQMIFVRSAQGRLDELVDTAESIAEQYPQLTGWRCGLAYMYSELGRTARARQQVEGLAHLDFQDLPRDANWLSNLSTLSQAVAFVDDAPRAQLLYEMLLPYADRCVVTFALLCQGSASRLLGMLATTLTRYDDAAGHFEQALTFNTRIRSPLWVAHTQHDYARTLLLRNDPGDRQKARELLDQALATAEELGLKALAAKTGPLKLTAQAATPSPAVPPTARTTPATARRAS